MVTVLEERLGGIVDIKGQLVCCRRAVANLTFYGVSANNRRSWRFVAATQEQTS